MKAHLGLHNRIVAALVLVFMAGAPAFGQTATLDDLFARLKTADEAESQRITQDIWIEWSKSGSPAARPMTSWPAAFISNAFRVAASVGDGLMRASESARKAMA